jgi:hypothetical protein
VDYTSASFKAAITALPLTSTIFWEIEGRTLIITKSGYIGLGSPYAKCFRRRIDSMRTSKGFTRRVGFGGRAR